MLLKVIKNNVLFFVLVLIACGSGTNTDSAKSEKIASISQIQKELVVGANRTEAYLHLLQGKSIAIVANQTSVVFRMDTLSKNTLNKDNYIHLVDTLLKHKVTIKTIFAPEHGFRGKADAGELLQDGVDRKTGIPIASLHGKHKKPTEAQLKGIDLVLFDIQDVGVRFYTYISTLHYVMEACAEQNIPVLILDRPNPNGNYVDGPTLEKQHSSFLGMHPIPLVHGMTIGEYAQMINGEKWLKNGVACPINIIQVENYMHESEYSLPIRPSPNLPNDQSIKLYPSLGLFEGTNINAGRGTEFQFQRYGAPFLDAKIYPFKYTPIANFGSKFPKHANQVCFGKDLSKVNTDRSFTLAYIIDAYTNSIDKDKFFNTNNFTIHAGTERLQQQIEAGLSEVEIRKEWQNDLNAYSANRQKYLLYD